MTTRPYRALVALLVVAVLVTGVTYATDQGSAQLVDDTELEDLLEDTQDMSRTERLGQAADAAYAALGALSDRWGYQVDQWLGDSSTRSAAEIAVDLSTYYNDHNATLEGWVNDRINATESADVVEITVYQDGSTATRYLVANVSGDKYTNTNMKNSTTRTVDHTVTLCGLAARESPDEIERFTEEYADPGNDLDQAYVAELGARYDPYVRSSLVSSADGCEEVAA